MHHHNICYEKHKKLASSPSNLLLLINKAKVFLIQLLD